MIITNYKDALNAIASASNSRAIALDVETTGLDMVDSEFVGLGIATRNREWYLDFMQIEEEHLPQLWAEIMQMCYGKDLVGHNVPFDLWIINREADKHAGEKLNIHHHFWWDTLSMAALYDENLIGVSVPIEKEDGVEEKLYALSLKALSYYFLGRTQRVWTEDFMEWSPDERAAYGCDDVRNTYDLAAYFAERLKEYNLLEYYRKFVAPLCYVTHEMERNGMMVDGEKLEEVKEELEELINEYLGKVIEIMPKKEILCFNAPDYEGGRKQLAEDLEELFYDLIDVEEWEDHQTKGGRVSTSKGTLERLWEVFEEKGVEDHPLQKIAYYEYEDANPNSNQELAAYLVSKGYHLPLTATGQPSVSIGVLEELAEEHPKDPIWEPLFDEKKLSKLQSTYVEACLELMWPEDGRVHPQWNQSGTATGRYSCSGSRHNDMAHPRGPALQTIPTLKGSDDDGWSYNPRKWFIAPKNKILCVFDLSQAEIAMLAVQSGCPDLLETILAGTDMHQQTADRMFAGWDLEKSEARRFAKTVNFGIMYGMGPHSLAAWLGIEVSVAKEIIATYYATFKGVAAYKQKIQTDITRKGFTTTFLGRRRSPILASLPPRVTAAPNTEEYVIQKRLESLWRELFLAAMKKSGYDDTTNSSLIEARAVRQGFNTTIQGSVAEMINFGLVELVREGWKVIGQVHDEIIVELDDTPETREALEKKVLELFRIKVNGVPFNVDISFGRSWACGKE